MSYHPKKDQNIITIRPRTRHPIARRARLMSRKYKIDTQRARELLIERLQETIEEAHKRATAKYTPTEDRQTWAKLEAYLVQTLNSILKSYDELYINQKLREMEEIVEELTEEDQ